MRKLLFLLLFSLLFFSCNFGSRKEDKGGANTKIEIFRYDKLLHEYVEYNSFSSYQKMNTDHLQATKFLIEDVLRLGQVNDTNIYGKLKKLYLDSTVHRLMTQASAKYEDVSQLEKDLTKGFRKLKKQVPAIKIPAVYLQISVLNESLVVGDSLIGISIDKYMGEDYPLYKQYFYDYQRKSLKPERILPDCFYYYLLSEYPLPEKPYCRLIDRMLHIGKLHYIVSKLLDYKSFGAELDYTPEQEVWCEQNEAMMWKYIQGNKHLYSTDPMVIHKYMKAAPYTAYFGESSPMMAGVWLGTQIVDKYMREHTNITIKQLLDMSDYNAMLVQARFNP